MVTKVAGKSLLMMLRRRDLVGLFAFACAFSTIVPAQERAPVPSPDTTLLQITTHGEVQRAPDIASIQAGVIARNADAKQALTDNTRQMTAVMAALKHAGVDGHDIQTNAVALQPTYVYGNGQSVKIDGYEARNTVEVRLRQMDKIGDVLAALVQQGANQIIGPTFIVDKPAAALDDARRDAMRQARARAELYAQATGLKVRRIVNISEDGQSAAPRPMPRMAMEINAATPSVPIATGENTLSVDLSVQFELGK